MVSRHPHIAIIRWKPEPVLGEDGKWTEGNYISLEVKCRFEERSKGVFDTQFGTVKMVYGYMVYLPLTSHDIPDTATITFESNTYSIARIGKYQKHMVIWL